MVRDEQEELIRDLHPGDGVSVTLDGKVEGVRIFSLGDGWGFGKLLHKRHLVSFNGIVADLYEDADVRLSGRWSKHPKYGWQIKLDMVEVVEPTTIDATLGWLAHRLPQVGPERARTIVNRWPPPELWRVLDEEPETLAEVRGLSVERAREVGAEYRRWKVEREQFVKLAEMGLKTKQIRRVVQEWGSDAADRLAENVYAAFPLFGWKVAEALGKRQKIRKADPRRVHAGFAYACQLRERDGHCCASRPRLVATAASAEVLALNNRKVEPLLADAVDAGVVVCSEGRYYRPETFKAERTVVEAVLDVVGGDR